MLPGGWLISGNADTPPCAASRDDRPDTLRLMIADVVNTQYFHFGKSEHHGADPLPHEFSTARR
jgi:hypothetical protein